jgi:hypothetical protein
MDVHKLSNSEVHRQDLYINVSSVHMCKHLVPEVQYHVSHILGDSIKNLPMVGDKGSTCFVDIMFSSKLIEH